jgi:hypothetical protein
MTNKSTDTSKPSRMPAKPKTLAKSPAKPKVAKAAKAPACCPSKEPSKIDKLLALLKRSGGATLPDLVKATGWLPPTTRAALTGLKKKGHTVERTKVDGVSRYSITATALK